MSIIHVAVAVLKNDKGEVLIQRRADDSHQGGLWEFPGGKLEVGENVNQALKREIKEELNINVIASRPLIRIQHDYDDCSVLLDVHWVDEWTGVVDAMEEQPIKWIQLDSFHLYKMPAADKPIITAIQLPACFVITPPHVSDPKQILIQLDQLLENGERLFLYRVKSLKNISHKLMIEQIKNKCNKVGAKLLLHEKNNVEDLLCSVDGLHLTENGLEQYEKMPTLLESHILSVSCHSLASLKKAQLIGADFAMLSPVETTSSHPDATPLGWDAFESVVNQSNIPVYALGGMTADKVKQAWSHGGQGVAGISSWWK